MSAADPPDIHRGKSTISHHGFHDTKNGGFCPIGRILAYPYCYRFLMPLSSQLHVRRSLSTRRSPATAGRRLVGEGGSTLHDASGYRSSRTIGSERVRRLYLQVVDDCRHLVSDADPTKQFHKNVLQYGDFAKCRRVRLRSSLGDFFSKNQGLSPIGSSLVSNYCSHFKYRTPTLLKL
jgi:hypothetical protein